MLFIESDNEWKGVPEWASFLVNFGYHWPKPSPKVRRIALISLPCDSAAAGLVSLGSLIRSLEDPSCNDVSRHLQRMQSGSDKIIRRYGSQHRFVLCGRKDEHGFWVHTTSLGRKNYSTPINEKNAFEWRFDDEPFMTVAHGNHLPYARIYRGLVDPSCTILESNLNQSYSGICLAGRIMGKRATRTMMARICFRIERSDADTGLDQLLTVYGWSSEMISRLLFFNSRTESFDRDSAPPHLIIADGDASFLRVISTFQESDIIAIIDRTLERQRLEEINQKMADLDTWYAKETEYSEDVPVAPRGISFAIWRRRGICQ